MSSPPSFFLHNSSPSAFYTLSLHDALPISFPVPVALFAAPILSENAARMIASIAVLPDVRVGVISQAPLEDLPEPVRSRVSHWRIPDVLDTAQLLEAVGQLEQRLGRADRLIGAYEQLQVPRAEVRE